eukprot:1502469-Amphidinium_carterae.4
MSHEFKVNSQIAQWESRALDSRCVLCVCQLAYYIHSVLHTWKTQIAGSSAFLDPFARDHSFRYWPEPCKTVTEPGSEQEDETVDNTEVARRRIAKKHTLEDFPKAAEKNRERLQSQLRQGVPIRVDQVPGILSSPDVVSPLRLHTEGMPLSSEHPTSNQPLTHRAALLFWFVALEDDR